LSQDERMRLTNLLCKNDRCRPYTLFAPTNDAFATLSADTLEFLKSPDGKEELIQILEYHVTPGNLYSSMFTNEEIDTLNGETATITVGPPVMIENAKVVGDQILAANGVVHPINEVLILPTKATTQAPVPVVLATAAPVTAAPITAAPVTATPVTAQPVVPATQPPITAAPVVPATQPPITSAPVTSTVATQAPAVLPVTQPTSASEAVVVIVGAQAAPAPASAPLPVLQIMASTSKDDKYDKYDKYDTTGASDGAVLSAMDASGLLGECQGDCDYNGDCAPGLACVDSKGLTSIPGCSGVLDGKGVIGFLGHSPVCMICPVPK
jgi:hypothetical protein